VSLAGVGVAGTGVAAEFVAGLSLTGVGFGVAALCVTAFTVCGVGVAGTGVAAEFVAALSFVGGGFGVAALCVTALTVCGVGVAGFGVAAELVTGVSFVGVGDGVGVGVNTGSGRAGSGEAAAVELVAADPMTRLATRVAAITNEKNASDAIRIGCSFEAGGWILGVSVTRRAPSPANRFRGTSYCSEPRRTMLFLSWPVSPGARNSCVTLRLSAVSVFRFVRLPFSNRKKGA